MKGWPVVSCCSPELESCICGIEERSLRAFASGELHKLPMTTDQRQWCLDEIAKVEGHSAAEHAKDSAQDLANAVLAAWTDYCRDKGLL